MIKNLYDNNIDGMSEFKLARDLRIPLKDAKQLINDYFTTFPKIGVVLNYFGRYGVSNGFIQTIYPYFRKRYFPDWNGISQTAIEAHIEKVQYHKTLGIVERASKNHPIQGSGADMVKTAMVYIRRFIKSNNLWDEIFLLIQVHDEQVTACVSEKSEWWAPIMTQLMEDAAYLIVPNGLLKSDTHITSRWMK